MRDADRRPPLELDAVRQPLKLPEPTRLDRAIERVSPKWAYKRYAAAIQLAGLRAYEAAQSARARKGSRSKGSADATNARSVEVLRQRARYMDENHDITSGVLDILESKVVGSEIQVHPMVMLAGGDELAEELNKHLAKLYREWCVRPETTRQHSWGQGQRLQCRMRFRDGESFLQHLDGLVPGLDHTTAVPYSVEIFEPDLVPMTGAETLGEDRELRYGVITNAWGQPVEYVVYLKHPGDNVFGVFAPRRNSLTHLSSIGAVKLVPARDVQHLKHVKRIRQTRGISALAPVFNRLEDLKDYEEAEQIAAKIGAYVALAITKSADAEPSESGSSSPRELEWMNGMIFDQLTPGERVESIKNERPSNQVGTFREVMLKSVAGGTRTGYSSISKNYNGTYSAQRQELVEQEVHYAVLTEEFISSSPRPVYRRFVGSAFIAGLLPRELLRGIDMSTLFNAAYRGPSVAYIDPKKEIDHELIGVQAGFWSKRSVQLKRGHDPHTVEAEIEQERKREKEKGIVTTSNPANKGAVAAVRPMVAPKEEDDEDDEPEENDDDNRGRRGRRGRRGPMPQHQWSDDGTRIRFEIAPGEWGEWSSPVFDVSRETQIATE